MTRAVVRRVLVTGVTGFIGRHLCAALRANALDVVGLSRKPHPSIDLGVHASDLLDVERLTAIVRDVRPDAVVHLAAARNRGIELGEYQDAYATNLVGTLNLIRACQQHAPLSRFVVLGTCEEYGRSPVPFEETAREMPVSAYGVSKLAATQVVEAAARAYGSPAIILRVANAYGSGQGNEMFLPALIHSLLLRRDFAMSPGQQTRDYIHVSDVVEAIRCALFKDTPPGSIVNVSSGTPVRIRDLAHLVAKSIGPEASDLLRIGAQGYRSGETMQFWANNARAADLLGWTPRISLEQGIAMTVASAREALGLG